MKLALKAKNITLTDAIKAFATEKVNALDAKVKRYGESVSAEMEVGLTTKHHKKGPIFRAELHVRLPGKLVYAECEDLNLYTAIVTAKKDAEKQIAHFKSVLANDRRTAKKTKAGRA